MRALCSCPPPVNQPTPLSENKKDPGYLTLTLREHPSFFPYSCLLLAACSSLTAKATRCVLDISRCANSAQPFFSIFFVQSGRFSLPLYTTFSYQSRGPTNVVRPPSVGPIFFLIDAELGISRQLTCPALPYHPNFSRLCHCKPSCDVCAVHLSRTYPFVRLSD